MRDLCQMIYNTNANRCKRSTELCAQTLREAMKEKNKKQINLQKAYEAFSEHTAHWIWHKNRIMKKKKKTETFMALNGLHFINRKYICFACPAPCLPIAHMRTGHRSITINEVGVDLWVGRRRKTKFCAKWNVDKVAQQNTIAHVSHNIQLVAHIVAVYGGSVAVDGEYTRGIPRYSSFKCCSSDEPFGRSRASVRARARTCEHAYKTWTQTSDSTVCLKITVNIIKFRST